MFQEQDVSHTPSTVFELTCTCIQRRETNVRLTDVYDVPLLVNHDVSIVSVLDLKEIAH